MTHISQISKRRKIQNHQIFMISSTIIYLLIMVGFTKSK